VSYKKTAPQKSNRWAEKDQVPGPSLPSSRKALHSVYGKHVSPPKSQEEESRVRSSQVLIPNLFLQCPMLVVARAHQAELVTCRHPLLIGGPSTATQHSLRSLRQWCCLSLGSSARGHLPIRGNKAVTNNRRVHSQRNKSVPLVFSLPFSGKSSTKKRTREP
jgi:hypothetical protein